MSPSQTPLGTASGGAYATSWRQAMVDPTTPRARIRRRIRGAALSTMGRLIRPPTHNFLRPLYGHYVFDDQVEAFEAFLAYATRIGSFVDSATCLAMLRGEREIDGRYFHLSFDDGFKNILRNAVPLMRRYDVPATVFVPSAIIGADFGVVERYCRETTRYGDVIEMLGWNDLEELVGTGFEVGSHSRTHARFSEISSDPARLEAEIFGSKLELEKRLGVPCRYMAWPYGTRSDADRASLEMTARAGYEACFGAFRGSVLPGTTDPFSIPRHQIEQQWPLSHKRFFMHGGLEASA